MAKDAIDLALAELRGEEPGTNMATVTVRMDVRTIQLLRAIGGKLEQGYTIVARKLLNAAVIDAAKREEIGFYRVTDPVFPDMDRRVIAGWKYEQDQNQPDQPDDMQVSPLDWLEGVDDEGAWVEGPVMILQPEEVGEK